MNKAHPSFWVLIIIGFGLLLLPYILTENEHSQKKPELETHTHYIIHLKYRALIERIEFCGDSLLVEQGEHKPVPTYLERFKPY